MATYYIDIADETNWNGRAGTSTGTCLYGLSGLQYLINSAAAGDTIYIKGTGKVSKLYSIPYDANSGTLTVGEEVTWDHGEGAWADGTDKGVVAYVGAQATPVIIQVKTGSTEPSDGDFIKGTTSGSTITAHTGITRTGVQFCTKSGTAAGGYIKHIGCNSSFVVDGTRAVFDSESDYGGAVVYSYHASGSIDMIWLENIKVQNSGSSGIGFHVSTDTGAAEGWVFINCCATGTYDGFRTSDTSIVTMIRCVSYSNRAVGFYLSAAGGFLGFCCAHDNTTDGFSRIFWSTLYGCVAHANSGTGFGDLWASSLINCVSDGNAANNIDTTSSTGTQPIRLIGCRITNAGTYGVDANNYPMVSGWSYFENNPGDNVRNTSSYAVIPLEDGSTTSNLEDLSNTGYGYVDATNHDFSTTYVDSGDPDLRRTAITVPWT